MNPAETENNKDFWNFVADAAIVHVILVLVVGGLFTLMLLFGKPVETT